ncbi:MAG: 2-oxo-4-hydroxy-4-carboxy-5-ureidoimidazoline decarboxylase [Longimicrobiales bacterium]
MDRLAWLNALPSQSAEAELFACCGAHVWAHAMTAQRPFPDLETVLAHADRVWWSLSEQDWREAFRAHPRIGERAAGWSEREQSGTRDASAELIVQLAEANRRYEQRFGHIFLICATGRSAGEMLAAFDERLANDARTELRVAAEEQGKITRLRLERLLTV